MYNYTHSGLTSLRPRGAYNLARMMPTRPRVLVVEDDEDIARGLQIVLQASFDVSVESRGVPAIETATLESPDLLLLDYQLPDINGIRLMEQIRRQVGAIPAIMISAHSHRRAAGLAAGFDHFLVKPYAPDELIAVAHNTLGLV